MSRDGLSEKDARRELGDAQFRVYDGDDPAEVLADEFGLEPDYIDDLI